MPTATNHTYLVTGHPAPSKKGNDDYFVSLTNLDGTKAVNPVTKKPLYVAVAPIDIALTGKVYSEGRMVKKAKNFDYIPNVGTRFLPDQTIDNFDLPGHDDGGDVGFRRAWGDWCLLLISLGRARSRGDEAAHFLALVPSAGAMTCCSSSPRVCSALRRRRAREPARACRALSATHAAVSRAQRVRWCSACAKTAASLSSCLLQPSASSG